jgi:hypothetical protein
MIKSRRMKWVGYVTCTGDLKNIYRILVRKPKGSRELERPGHR